MIIWILGWAGRVWQALIQEALWCKHKVITLVRNKYKLQQYKNRITIVQWDATHTDDMINFLSQVDVVIHAVSVPLFHKKPTKLYSQTTQTIISARWSGRCKKLIVMSNTWTQHGRKLPWPANLAYELLLGDVADDKETEELLLQKSWLPWIIIKSPVLTNGQKKNYTLQNFDTYKATIFSFISRKTIASVIINIAENNTYNQQKIVPNSKFLF
jgi:putative NADH-flavin reductase